MYSQSTKAVNAEHHAATVFPQYCNNYRIIRYNKYCFSACLRNFVTIVLRLRSAETRASARLQDSGRIRRLHSEDAVGFESNIATALRSNN